MDEALHALCLSVEPALSADVTAALTHLPGFSVRTREADYQSGLRDLRDPDLVIVILAADATAGLNVIEDVLRALPSTRVLALSRDESPELIIKSMRAGADEFLPLPVTPTALLKVCIKVSETRRSSGPAQARKGEVWAAYGPKGGVGVTTVVTNLAFALRAAQRDTVLVDLDVYNGDLALFLNLTPTYTLRDITTNFRRLDSVFLQGTMSRHPSGIELLAAPPVGAGEPPLELSGDQIRSILELLRSLHEVTLVDTAGLPSDATRTALAVANRILLVTELTIPSLRGCIRTLDWLREEDSDVDAKVEIIVNKYANKGAEVPLADATRTLKLPTRAILPRDDATAIAAINNGLSLEEVRGGNPLARAIAALVTPGTPPADGGAKRKGLMRLFSTAERSA